MTKAKKLTKPQIQALHIICARNLATFPAIAAELSKQIGVSQVSLTMAEAGYYPLGVCWTFPERDATGAVIGLSTRTMDGKKFMIAGSKHGLFFMVNTESEEEIERRDWKRTDVDHPCPKCDKPDGCLYPEGEYKNPAAVICRVKSEGAVKEMKFGHLHILDAVRNRARTMNRSLLRPTNHPYLIVEGNSDMCAAFDLGFVAVGRPNDKAQLGMLQTLVAGKSVCIIGENDKVDPKTGKQAGVDGMEKTFAKLHGSCPTCIKLLPIPEVKDLRQWKQAGLTQEILLQYINSGETCLDPDIFSSDDPAGINDEWLRREKTIDGVLTLRMYQGDMVEFNGHRYETISKPVFHGQVLEFLRGKSFVDDKGEVKPCKCTERRIRDVAYICCGRCPVTARPPVWLDDGDHPDPARLIIFQNGILNVDDYIAGKINLMNPDPRLFAFNVMPYDFDENAESARIDDFHADVLSGDPDKIRLMDQWHGYTLIPDMSHEKLMMFVGLSRGGKGVCIDIMSAMLGGRVNCSNTSFRHMNDRFPFDVLQGKLAAFVSEAKISKPKDIEEVLGELLRVVGRDTVEIRRKYKDTLGFESLFCRFTLAMNALPAFVDNSLSLENRTCLLNFNNTYAGQEDTTLKTILPAEAASGKLINRALRGLVDLHKNGFVTPAESADAMKTFRALISPLVAFSERVLADDPTGFVDAGQLYLMWQWWCKREGHSCTRKNTFVSELVATRPTSKIIWAGERDNADQAVAGVAVTQWATDKFLKGE